MYELKVELNDADFFAFNKYHTLNSKAGKQALLGFRCITPLVCLLIVFIFWICKAEPFLIITESVLLAILSILWVVFAPKMLLKSLKTNMKKIKQSGRLPYNKDVVLKFDDEQICEVSPEAESRTKYALVEKIAITDEAIYIYFSAVQAYILPLSAFADAQQRQAFLAFINSKIGNRAEGVAL